MSCTKLKLELETLSLLFSLLFKEFRRGQAQAGDKGHQSATYISQTVVGAAFNCF